MCDAATNSQNEGAGDLFVAVQVLAARRAYEHDAGGADEPVAAAIVGVLVDLAQVDIEQGAGGPGRPVDHQLQHVLLGEVAGKEASDEAGAVAVLA